MSLTTKQYDRFKEYLNHCQLKLTDYEFAETMVDLENWELEKKQKMDYDTFKDRLVIRVK